MAVFTDQDRQRMDNAAVDAQNDIGDSEADLEAMRVVASWWKKWVAAAGHRRLGRILLGYAGGSNRHGKEAL